MARKTDPLWDESDPHYAPGMVRRARKAGTKFYWLPRAHDIKKGYRPKSRELPRGGDDATIRERARLCREYEQDLHLWRQGGNKAPEGPSDGTIRAIAQAYQNDEDSPFHELRHSTQTNYRYYLRPVIAKLGKRHLAQTTGKDLRRWHKQFREAAADPEKGRDGAVMARQCIYMIRVLAKYAVEIGHMDCAHIGTLFENMRFKGAKARTIAPQWADIEALVRTADDEARPSIGTATLMQFELAQRQGDIIGVWEPTHGEDDRHGIVYQGRRWSSGALWSDIDADWTLTIAQNKSGGRTVLEFPLKEFPAIYERLKAVPPEKRVGPIIVSEGTGRPYTKRGFADVFRKIARKAGWPDEMRNMDARAGAATEIAAAVQDLAIEGKDAVGQGFVRSHTGHRDAKMEDRYTRTTRDTVTRVAQLRRARRDKNER